MVWNIERLFILVVAGSSRQTTRDQIDYAAFYSVKSLPNVVIVSDLYIRLRRERERGRKSLSRLNVL